MFLADTNGDGITDMLIKKSRFDERIGIYFTALDVVVFGSPNLTDEFIFGIPPPNPFHALYQTTLGDHLGESLAVRDINGDGVPDILIGAPGVTSNENGRVEYLSRAHVILGSTEIKSGAQINTAQSQQDITISFNSKTSGVGRQVGSGDFNGDGFSDILLGSDRAVYVFFGGPLRPPEITKAKYRSSSSDVVIFGTDFTGSARVEINGMVVDREVSFDPDTNKLVLHAEKSELNLRAGKNQVVVIRKGARSNSIKLKVQ